MRYKYLFLLIFLLVTGNFYSFPVGHSVKHENSEFSRVEIELIEDLVSGNEQERNFIFFGYKLDFSCFNFTCEKYSLAKLGVHLSIRGERFYYKKNVDSYYPGLHNLRIENAGSSDRNIIILKFQTFSVIDMMHLDQIRAYNMKSFFVVFAEDGETFSNLQSYILKTKLFNIYMIRRSSNMQVYLTYEVCAYCTKGKSELRFYKEWQENRGFNTQFRFSSSFKGSFFGAKVKVGTLIYPPAIFPVGISEGKPIYGGDNYMLLETLAKSLNFTIKLSVPSDYKGCNYDQKRKSYVGSCKMLQQKEVDFGFLSSIHYQNFHVADPTGVYNVIYN